MRCCSATSRCRQVIRGDQRAGRRGWQDRLGLGGAGKGQGHRCGPAGEGAHAAARRRSARPTRISEKHGTLRRASAEIRDRHRSPKLAEGRRTGPPGRSIRSTRRSVKSLEKALVRGRIIAGENAHRRSRPFSTVRQHHRQGSACCHVSTARRCSPAVRPRRSSRSPSARRRDAQIIDALEGEYFKRAIHAPLQFPALLSVGETGVHAGPGSAARLVTDASPSALCWR